MGKNPVYVPGKDYSVKELIRMAEALGWEIRTKPGGSGYKVARKPGCLPFDIPSNPSKKTKQKILRQMGLK